MISCADLPLASLWNGVRPSRSRLIEAWFAHFGRRCLFCDQEMLKEGRRRNARPDRPTLDHIDALSLGGTDTLENIQVICSRCNSLKAGAEHAILRRFGRAA